MKDEKNRKDIGKVKKKKNLPSLYRANGARSARGRTPSYYSHHTWCHRGSEGRLWSGLMLREASCPLL